MNNHQICPPGFLNNSNNILGIEYLKALRKINSKIKPCTINRFNNKYNCNEITDGISSATSIRNSILEDKNIDLIKNVVPSSTFNLLKEELRINKGPVFTEDFAQVIISIIRKISLEELRDIFDVNEGLEHRIKTASIKASSIKELISLIKSKRYTQTRIQRILYHALIGINKEIYSNLRTNYGPQYIRVLGFNENGQKLLNIAKQKTSLPIITKVADFKNIDNSLFNKILEYEITATNIYTLGYKNLDYKVGNLDYTHNIEIIKS